MELRTLPQSACSADSPLREGAKAPDGRLIQPVVTSLRVPAISLNTP